MSYSHQQSALRRKVAYFGIIIALFVLTTFVRGLVASPFSGGLDQKFQKWNIASQAERLEMSENSQGEMELTGSAFRLLFTGSRGLLICAMWDSAIDKQKRHEWTELELIVRAVTKLQPHFITPWMFQSWNLSYNVSVEMDNLGDMYSYIARGIGLLAEGESINRYNPDMRYYIAFYYQNKFGVSDKVTTLRCLLQLSCLPPHKRDVSELQRGNQVQLQAFEEFCKNNPRLIRKLREMPIRYGKQDGKDQIMYLCSTPAKVVNFISKHKTVLDDVSRYPRNGKALQTDYLKQFPVLPPPFIGGLEELTPAKETTDGTSDAHLVARAWYSYANEAAPPPNDEPGPTDMNYIDPERKRRVPKQPMEIIFKQGPPRAQSYVAEWLAKEGWYDKDPWMMDKGADPSARWFPGASDDQPVMLSPTATSQLAWNAAKDMWEKDGKENGLLFSEDRNRLYYERAKVFARHRNRPVEERPQDLLPSERNDPELVAGYKAQLALSYLKSNLQVTQFDSFYNISIVESMDATILARKKFFDAEQYRVKQMLSLTIANYDAAFAEWKKILYAKENSKYRLLEVVQRESYELNFRYLMQVRERDEVKLKERTRNIIATVSPVALLPKDLKTKGATSSTSMFSISQPFWFDEGPLDGVDKDGKPWIRPDVREMVKSQNMMPVGPAAAGNRPQGKSAPPPKAVPKAAPLGGPPS